MMSKTNWYIIGLVIVGAVVRLAALGGVEFWYDEAFSALTSRLAWSPMIAATAGDTHPPLFYALMWFWTRTVGSSEYHARLLSVIAGLAALPVAWRVMRRLTLSDPVRLAVLTMMSLSAFQVYFSQEARMYALLQLFNLLAVLAVLERRWWLLAVMTVGLLYLHNYGLIYVAVLPGLLYLVLSPEMSRRAVAEHIVYFVFLPALLYLPWALVLAGQVETISSGYWIEPVTLGQVIYTLAIFMFGQFTRQWALAGVLVTIGGLVYALIRLAEGWRWPTTSKTAMLQRSLILYLAAAPLILAVLSSILIMPMYLYRGLIGCAPFLYMFILQPLADKTGWRRVYGLSLITSMVAIGLAGYWLDVRGFKSTTLDVIHRIQAEWQDGDILYSTNDGNWVMFTAYQSEPVYLMPQCADHDRGALSEQTRAALGVPIAELDAIDHRRAWVLWNHGAPTSQCNYDRAAEMIGDREPWYIATDNELQSAGVWLIDVEEADEP